MTATLWSAAVFRRFCAERGGTPHSKRKRILRWQDPRSFCAKRERFNSLFYFSSASFALIFSKFGSSRASSLLSAY